MRRCYECNREWEDRNLFCHSDGTPLENNLVLNRKYEITEKIGKGGMGFVYKARHTDLGNLCAIKVLKPHLVATDYHAGNRFLREAKVAAQINHENAIKVTDYDVYSDYHFFVMEYLEGEDLERRISGGTTLSFQQDSNFLSQVCSALSEAHKLGILHRDIKPSNIFITSDRMGNEKIKVLDFGVAKILDFDETQITQTGAIIGTAQYMSPEQCNGEKDIDHRSDIYSLGVVLYQLLTGQVPFSAPSGPLIMVKHISENPRPFKEIKGNIPNDIETVVMRALSKERNKRQQTANELAQEFNNAVQTYESGLSPTPAIDTPVIPVNPPSPPNANIAVGSVTIDQRTQGDNFNAPISAGRDVVMGNQKRSK